MERQAPPALHASIVASCKRGDCARSSTTPSSELDLVAGRACVCTRAEARGVRTSRWWRPNARHRRGSSAAG